MSHVAVVDSMDVRRGINQALDVLTQAEELFGDKHVAIKINETWASEKDKTACTQSDTLSAVIQYVKKYRPRKITVSGGAGAAETEDVFNLLGIDTIIEKEEVDYFDHNKPPFEEVKLDYGPQGSVMINPHIFEYDTLISLAQLKVHSSATVTLTMKNIAMSYPAADYYGHPRNKKLHDHAMFENLHAFIVGMCKRFPIHLGIVVGHPAMIEKGPIGGQTFEAGLIIASTDAVAADAVGSYILDRKNVDHIVLAEKNNLGSATIGDIHTEPLTINEAVQLFQQRLKKGRKTI